MILVGRSQSKLDAQAKEAASAYHVDVHTIAVDLSKPEDAQTIYDTCKENNWLPDVIINNAGEGAAGLLDFFLAHRSGDHAGAADAEQIGHRGHNDE